MERETMVTQSRPAKHGKNSDGKQVLASSLNRCQKLSGVYRYDEKLDKSGLFNLETASGLWCLVKKMWSIEELITSIK